MKIPYNRHLAVPLFLMFSLWAKGGTPNACAQHSTPSIVDAPRDIVEAIHSSAFVGSGSFISNAPVSSVFGCSHEAWFYIHEAVVNHSSGDVLRLYVDCLKSDPAAGFGPLPRQSANDVAAWGNTFKLLQGKTYHVVVIPMSKPNPYLLLDKLVSDDDWLLFRQDILDAKAGRYVWRDPVVLKQREWRLAADEAEQLYQQMKAGTVSREAWKQSESRAESLFDEYKAIRGTNTAIRCP